MALLKESIGIGDKQQRKEMRELRKNNPEEYRKRKEEAKLSRQIERDDKKELSKIEADQKSEALKTQQDINKIGSKSIALTQVADETKNLSGSPSFSERKKAFLESGTEEEKQAKAKFYNPDPTLERNSLNAGKAAESINRGKSQAARIADVFGAISAGYRGQQYTPYSERFKKERQADYQEYKDIAARNKKAIGLWELDAQKQWQEWLENRAKDESLTERERIKAQAKAAEAKEQTNRLYAKHKLEMQQDATKEKAKQSYLDIYKKEYGHDTSDLKEYVAEKYNIDTQDVTSDMMEEEAENALAQDYNISVDDYGVKSAVKKEGLKGTAIERNRAQSALEKAESELEEAQEALNSRGRKKAKTEALNAANETYNKAYDRAKALGLVSDENEDVEIETEEGKGTYNPNDVQLSSQQIQDALKGTSPALVTPKAKTESLDSSNYSVASKYGI